jgi:3-methyladenine DNA glycosylase AlkC
MLSKDPRSAIVSYVSANPSTSRETLMMLSKNPYAIRGVSSNPSAPQELIDTLSNHKDLYVRIGVAKNPNTSITILKKLSKDENEYVKQQAQKVLKQKNKLA